MSVIRPAILTDVTKCTGCERCVAACQKANHLPKEQPWRWVKQIDDLSTARWTTIRRVRTDSGDRFVRKHCRHCLDPECVSVCIVGALQKSPQGPVIYDRDICIGCRYCMIACPWEIPRYSWEDTVPYVQKCDLCYQAVVREGKHPACVEACPYEATVFGDRDELLARAKQTLADNPQRYVQTVFGEKQVGGTSVLYISDIDLNLTDLGKPIRDPNPMPDRTTKILHQTPIVFVAMAGMMGGIHWIIKRRQKLMSQGADDKPPANQADQDAEQSESDSDEG